MTARVAVGNLPGMAQGLSGWRLTCSLLVVIPAKAGIQEGGDTVVKGWRVLSDGALVVIPVVIPAWREWIEQTTGFRLSPE